MNTADIIKNSSYTTFWKEYESLADSAKNVILALAVFGLKTPNSVVGSLIEKKNSIWEIKNGSK